MADWTLNINGRTDNDISLSDAITTVVKALSTIGDIQGGYVNVTDNDGTVHSRNLATIDKEEFLALISKG